jgi:tRNA threonylcarbamoyladenosine biosynthesis protein TsaE
MADGDVLTVISRSLRETQRLGALIGELLEGQEVICLEGELGTGKTSLIQAIGRAQGVTQPITSPTFTLVNLYSGRSGTIYHVDLYRLGSLREILQSGIDAYFYDDGICLVEWAEKAGELLPPAHLYILLQHAGGDTRRIFISARGDSAGLLLDRLRNKLGVLT